MVTIIGVKFQCAGKIYYFDPGDQKISRGMSVIVETARGVEMGTVMLENKEVEEDAVVQPLKPVIRIATTEDFDVVREHKEKEKEAYKICQEKIRERQLEMKLVDVEYTFDGNKILFYFTADGRIDFRELVKDLASVFKTRIELRQIGVRDETKMLGGIGICGRCLCCSSYLSDFIPVSIKMAKEQSLSLNPSKISGVCGRLMCCLKNEEDTYEYLNSHLPSVGEKVFVEDSGEVGTVQTVNVLRQRVKVIISSDDDNVDVKEFPVEKLKFRSMKREDEEGNILEEPFDLDTYIEKMQVRRPVQEPTFIESAYEETGTDGREGESDGPADNRRSRREGRRDSRNNRRNREGNNSNGEREESRGRRERAEESGEPRGRRERAEESGDNRGPRGSRGNGNAGNRNRNNRNNRRGKEAPGEAPAESSEKKEGAEERKPHFHRRRSKGNSQESRPAENK